MTKLPVAARPYLWALLVIVLMPVIGLGLHVASFALSDRAAITPAIIDASASGTLVDPAEPEGPARFLPSWFSECVTLSILAREQGQSGLAPLLRNESIVWNPPESLCQTLRRAAVAPGDVAWFSYARYWHGNLVLHRLILSLGGYDALRAVLAVIVALAFLVFCRAVRQIAGMYAMLALAIVILLASDLGVAALMPTQAISLAALLFSAALIFLCVRRDGPALYLAAFTAGAIYNYFDFLYNPALLAGLAAFGIFVARAGRSRLGPLLVRGIAAFALVFVGYGMMWAMKWGLVAWLNDLAGDDTAIVLAQDFSRWGGGGRDGVALFSASAAMAVKTFETAPAIIVFVLAAIITTVMSWRRVHGRDVVLAITPLILALMTLEMIAGHSDAHVWFTHRTLPWLIAAGFALLLARADQARSPSG